MDAALNEVRKFHRQIGAAVADSPMLLACDAASATGVAVAIRGLLTRCRTMAGDGSDLLSRLCLALEELAEWVEAHAADDLVAAADAWGAHVAHTQHKHFQRHVLTHGSFREGKAGIAGSLPG